MGPECVESGRQEAEGPVRQRWPFLGRVASDSHDEGSERTDDGRRHHVRLGSIWQAFLLCNGMARSSSQRSHRSRRRFAIDGCCSNPRVVVLRGRRARTAGPRLLARRHSVARLSAVVRADPCCAGAQSSPRCAPPCRLGTHEPVTLSPGQMDDLRRAGPGRSQDPRRDPLPALGHDRVSRLPRCPAVFGEEWRTRHTGPIRGILGNLGSQLPSLATGPVTASGGSDQ